MSEIGKAIVQSVLEEKAKQGTNLFAAGVGQYVLPEWMSIAGALLALAVPCAILYSTLQQIRINKRLLDGKRSPERRREESIMPKHTPKEQAKNRKKKRKGKKK